MSAEKPWYCEHEELYEDDVDEESDLELEIEPHIPPPMIIEEINPQNPNISQEDSFVFRDAFKKLCFKRFIPAHWVRDFGLVDDKVEFETNGVCLSIDAHQMITIERTSKVYPETERILRNRTIIVRRK